MHFEILVEDRSGKSALDHFIPKILGNSHTFRVLPYKGIGHIPRDLNNDPDPSKRILLDNLPRLIKGYGRTFANYEPNYSAAIIVVCDLDDKCLRLFRRELLQLLGSSFPRPETHYCIAIEEGEAWLLGDKTAIEKAYPKAKKPILSAYINDSICGTWETLADAVYPGGHKALEKEGWQGIGREKSEWATNIAPLIDISNNSSPSFCYFRDKLLSVVTAQSK